MEAIALAIGNMMGAMRLQHQREQSDQDQKHLIAELERSNRELEQFGYISSHDMQEPLRMVILYLELLQRRYGDTLDAQANEYVGFAVEGAQRMHAMILDLLQYCRLGGSKRKKTQASIQVQPCRRRRGISARTNSSWSWKRPCRWSPPLSTSFPASFRSCWAMPSNSP